MIKLFFALLVVSFSSCSLFDGFTKRNFSYSEKGNAQSVELLIPSRYSRSEMNTDSSGNQELFYYYPGGGVLYFVYAKDSAKQYQYINYDVNIPKPIYNGIFFKGIDSNHLYWRETLLPKFKLGYRNVERGNDWRFDSSLNYFQLQRRDQ